MLGSDIQQSMADAPLPPGLNVLSAAIDHGGEWVFLIDLTDFMRLFRVYEIMPHDSSTHYTASWRGYVFKAVKLLS